ncbi:MAG: hypothetical protein TRG1_1623 [Flavobacteriaceae bacterium FS1-H7996/R]|nr:MAG: hypothetical protein TRG1_1623 [Flavobacteriaceae bacterium FS1-H7996/R]
MSAIEPAFTSGINFECLMCMDLDVNVMNASQKQYHKYYIARILNDVVENK